jgi:PRTRC genetic system protein D
MTVAIDVGYGRTKIVTANKRDMFDSHLVRYKSSSLDFMKKTDKVEVDNFRYYVGENALAEGSPISLIGDHFHGSKEWKALLAYALYGIREQGSHVEKLVLGLPLSQYNEQRKQQLRAVKDFRFSVNGEDYQFTFDKIFILPQGAGAILEYITQEDGTAIVDIGYYTLDLAAFREGEFSVEQSASINYGIQKLYHSIAKELNRRWNISPDTKKIEKLLRSGKLLLEGQEIDIREMLTELKFGYAEDLVSRLNDNWSEVLKDVNRVVFIGGGTEVIRDILPDKANFLVPQEPSFANAAGFFKYGESFGG